MSEINVEQKKILKNRANFLARETKVEMTNGRTIQVVEFLLAYEKYGIELSYVREVYPLKELTFIPGTPEFVLGIVNVRGQILSVVDLKKFFELPEKGLTDLNRIIILHNDSMEFCILADVIVGVRTMPESDLQPSLPTLTGVREEFLKGITRDRVAILDARKLLGHEKIIVQSEV